MSRSATTTPKTRQTKAEAGNARRSGPTRKKGRTHKRGAYDHIVEPLRRFATKIDTLKPDPNNAALHTERNIAAIRRSLVAFGQDEPVIFQADSRIVRVGNGRLIAARELVKEGDKRFEYLAAIPVSDDNLKAAARAVAHNRTGELAGWDRDVLGGILKAIREGEGVEVEALGFSDDEVTKLIDRLSGDKPATPAAAAKSVTFRIPPADHVALIDHLKTFDDNRNTALSLWLASATGKATRT